MTQRQRRAPARPLTAGQRARQLANLANGTTLLGLALARAAGTAVGNGPRGLVIAAGYRWRLPHAGAFTLGNVVICRAPAALLTSNAALLGHEEKHCSQYACCLGLPFLPLYFLAAAGRSYGPEIRRRATSSNGSPAWRPAATLTPGHQGRPHAAPAESRFDHGGRKHSQDHHGDRNRIGRGAA